MRPLEHVPLPATGAPTEGPDDPRVRPVAVGPEEDEGDVVQLLVRERTVPRHLEDVGGYAVLQPVQTRQQVFLRVFEPEQRLVPQVVVEEVQCPEPPVPVGSLPPVLSLALCPPPPGSFLSRPSYP